MAELNNFSKLHRSKNRNFEFEILNLLRNKLYRWNEFIKENFSQSTLSNKLKDLINNDYVVKTALEDKGKRIKCYQITDNGRIRLEELSTKESFEKELNVPPEKITNIRDHIHILLWLMYNNDYCVWKDFFDERIKFNSATLSKKLKLLIKKGYIKKDDKKYKITPDGISKYYEMLKFYDLDRQSILEQESKKLREISTDINSFFEKYDYKEINDNIKFRFLNIYLRFNYSKVKEILSEEDFKKILLYISINHPNEYDNIYDNSNSIEAFSNRFDLHKSSLEFFLHKIVEENKFLLKFFKLEQKNDEISRKRENRKNYESNG